MTDGVELRVAWVALCFPGLFTHPKDIIILYSLAQYADRHAGTRLEPLCQKKR